MKFFSLENPIWKFIGNLADFFLLSCLWYLCCLPVVTAGAATTALYYVTLKMARGQEGQLIPAFFHSFKQNLKQATALWVGYLAVGILLVLDLVICQHLTLHDLNALIFHKKFPHQSRTSTHSLFSSSYSIYPSRQLILTSVPVS